MNLIAKSFNFLDRRIYLFQYSKVSVNLHSLGRSGNIITSTSKQNIIGHVITIYSSFKVYIGTHLKYVPIKCAGKSLFIYKKYKIFSHCSLLISQQQSLFYCIRLYRIFLVTKKKKDVDFITIAN